VSETPEVYQERRRQLLRLFHQRLLRLLPRRRQRSRRNPGPRVKEEASDQKSKGKSKREH